MSYRRNLDYFDNYVLITSRFGGTCRCGAQIEPRGRMAWNRYTKRALCYDCYNVWKQDVSDEDAMSTRFSA